MSELPSLSIVGTAFLVVAIILGAGVIFGALAGLANRGRTEKDRKELRGAINDFCTTIENKLGRAMLSRPFLILCGCCVFYMTVILLIEILKG